MYVHTYVDMCVCFRIKGRRPDFLRRRTKRKGGTSKEFSLEGELRTKRKGEIWQIRRGVLDGRIWIWKNEEEGELKVEGNNPFFSTEANKLIL